MAAVYNSSITCSTLSSLLPGKVSYPRDATYSASKNSYYSQNDRLEPICIVKPTSGSDVALVIKSLSKIQEKHSSLSPVAAVRGGGHTPFAGAANIDNGVTIDLSGLDAIEIKPSIAFPSDSSSPIPIATNSSADTTSNIIVSVGGGAIWGDLSKKLQPMNIAVVGGRGLSLGLGGLTTGGGISFFSPQRGFACDHVVNMEVVLADGSIIDANAQEYSDLFRALKGGSGNFGIVTRFDLETFPQADFWGGFLSYPSSTVPEQLIAFGRFMDQAKSDPHAAVICALGYVGAYDTVMISNGLHYTKPVKDPPILQPFTKIQPQLQNSMRISNNYDFMSEIESRQAQNFRATFVTTSFAPTTPMIQEVYQIWHSTLDSIKKVAGIAYFLVFQRLPAIVPGNSLGLDVSDNLVVLCLSVTWSQVQDDETINTVTQALIDRIDEATTAAGLFHPFKFLNYAARFQDPIASYGPANKAQLQTVSKKYDPAGSFQRGIPGGFKLFTH